MNLMDEGLYFVKEIVCHVYPHGGKLQKLLLVMKKLFHVIPGRKNRNAIQKRSENWTHHNECSGDHLRKNITVKYCQNHHGATDTGALSEEGLPPKKTSAVPFTAQ
ncbi:hypothetical protein CDAR_541131 [Caerostris darwini]|uniref:Uncharacterized protein n=1 Tax=Caerostris darwini TaxID=1538125 RepID=A0AAV4WCT5_9ARAC|nr:hypothetical protein CDAR_541131 [Caerostris darwini]